MDVSIKVKEILNSLGSPKSHSTEKDKATVQLYIKLLKDGFSYHDVDNEAFTEIAERYGHYAEDLLTPAQYEEFSNPPPGLIMDLTVNLRGKDRSELSFEDKYKMKAMIISELLFDPLMSGIDILVNKWYNPFFINNNSFKYMLEHFDSEYTMVDQKLFEKTSSIPT